MTQPSLNEKQLAELAEIVEIARIAKEKARKLYETATEIAEKWQLRVETRQAATHKQQN